MIATAQRGQRKTRVAAKQLIDEARGLGIDGVKLVVRGDSAGAEPGDTLADDIPTLLDCARGLAVFLAPYDVDAVDRLAPLSFAGWTIDASLLTHLPLLERVARDRRPVVAAVVGCTKPELDEALLRLSADATLMHTLMLGAAATIVDLAYMSALRQYRPAVAFADFAPDTALALAAVALGAAMVEKPLRLERAGDGDTAPEGLLPHEFRSFMSSVTAITAVLAGEGIRDPRPEELDVVEQDRVAIVTSRSIPCGTILDRGMLTLAAVGAGLPPRLLPFVEGRRILYDIPSGSVLTFGLIEL